ncbi:DoxX family protein [Verrucomicrobiales bacterium]|jgi:uncharacterized membrane protein YphA (DoxX/SURF4 family)|nr:DoxX family protein [Verrucomicrobiales bacterium]|tara:strand:- start:35 stop:502 length:468 start_codon:yes stop_codon:yes gene_type:complete
MPFQPLPDTGPEKTHAPDAALFIIRFFAALAFFYYQFYEQVRNAVNFIWSKTEWDLVTQLADKGLPLPNILTVVVVALMSIALVAIALGIFSRINGLIATLITGFILIAPIDLSNLLNPQGLVLYLAVFIGITIGGAGKLSLDYRLAGRKAKRKK